MLEFLRNLNKSDEDKRQEMINAFLDDALSPQEKARFVDQLDADQNLRSELEQYQWLRQSINQLPRKRAPRNFTLDPVVYGRPASSFPVYFYPALRTATVLAGLIFVFLIGFDFISSSQDSPSAISSISQQLGETADVGLAAEAAVEEALESAELSEEAPISAEAPIPGEAPIPADSVVEEEADIQELQTETEIDKAAVQESSPLIIQQESEEEAPPAEGIAEESAPGGAAPEERPPVLSEAEASFEDSAADSESDSILPSASGPLTGLVGGTPAITLTIVPTRTESETSDEEIADSSGDTAQEMDAEKGQTSSEPAVEGAAVLGRNVAEAATAEPDIANGAVRLFPTEKPIAADRSTDVEQRNYPSLRLFEIILGIGLVVLIILTLLLRGRSQNYH